jgi:hypothetical protein
MVTGRGDAMTPLRRRGKAAIVDEAREQVTH